MATYGTGSLASITSDAPLPCTRELIAVSRAVAAAPASGLAAARERAGQADSAEEGKRPCHSHSLASFHGSQQLANFPLFHERQRIVDFLNDDESLRR